MRFKKCIAILLASLIVAQSFTSLAYANTPAKTPKEEAAYWITATSSILNWSNNQQDLGRSEYRLFDLPDRDRLVLTSLSRLHGWNIFNADDLRRSINNLTLGQGHNISFVEAYRAFRAAHNHYGDDVMSILEIDSNERSVDAFNHTLRIGERWGNRGIIAWDLFRVGTLISWGYTAGFIEREEAYLLMEPAINLLKFYFISWTEAVENYLDGYLFWSIRGGMDIEESLEEVERRMWIFVYILTGHPYVFGTTSFSYTPTLNLQRAIVPTDDLLDGYWYLRLDNDMFTEFYFNSENRTAALVQGIQNDPQILFSGFYFFALDRLHIRFDRISEGGVTSYFDEDHLVRYLPPIYFSYDGSQMIILNILTGQMTTYERSQGDMFENLGIQDAGEVVEPVERLTTQRRSVLKCAFHFKID